MIDSLTARTMNKKEQMIRFFGAIGRRYDLADTLMSFGLQFFWRRICLRHLELKAGLRVLDLCGGTGKFARRVSKVIKGKGISVVCDLSRPMMAAGKNRAVRTVHGKQILWVEGDAEALGFAGGVFDFVIIGFGIRNLANLEQGLKEIFRVLKQDGALLILEFSVPVTHRVRELYRWYSFKVMPPLGKAITGHDAPFRYLADSVRSFHSPESMGAILDSSGFSRVTFQRLSNGIVTVYFGMKRSAVAPAASRNTNKQPENLSQT
jgi:demethylmenaquinone methyltransferase/2-methoxy-6-polyprenyl-1,4-benzoquinol methylase